MDVKVRFFAVLRETLGEGERMFRFPKDVACEEVLAQLKNVFKDAASILEASRLAVNGHFVSKNMRLAPGDEVEILPPVSGG